MSTNVNYFKGLNFFLSTNPKENSIPKKRIDILTKLIPKHGGKLAETPNKSDYIISNKVGHNMGKGSEIVSPDYISQCIEEKTLLSIDSFLVKSKPEEESFETPQGRKKEVSKQSKEPAVSEKYECQKPCKLGGPNEDIIDKLSTIKNHRYVTGNARSELSYSRAIAGIRSLGSRIRVENVKKIPFIGPKISAYVTDYLETGEMPEVKEILNDDHYHALDRFTKIHGVGPKTAKDFYKKGYRQLKDIPAIELSQQQKVGIKYYDDFQKPLSQKECAEIVEIIRKHVYPEGSLVEATGGYRRGKKLSNDLDILIKSPNTSSLEKTISALKKAGYVAEILTQTTHPVKNDLDKCFFVWKGNGRMHRVDILVATPEQYPFAMLGWTGNQQFERSLRLYTDRERNWHLTSVGLYTKNGKKVKGAENVTDEKDIFELLGVEYRPPEERNC
jgi:DNA polymerase IV